MIAPRDIRAQRDATFTSESRTEEAKAQAADEVVPVTETIKSPTDNQEDQLLAYDTLTRRVDRVLDLRDAGSIEDGEVIDRLANDAEEIPFTWREVVARLDANRWTNISEAGRVALGTILAEARRREHYEKPSVKRKRKEAKKRKATSRA